MEQCSRRRTFHGSDLADGEILFVVKHLPIDRFDIVVAHEEDGNKDIVKRVIGMPGDTIRYENDKLYINDKETDEPYLADYIKRFKDDKPKALTQARALKEIKELSLEVSLKSSSLHS